MIEQNVTLEEAVDCVDNKETIGIEVIFKPPFESISRRYTSTGYNNNWLMSYIDKHDEPKIIKDIFVKKHLEEMLSCSISSVIVAKVVR